MLVLARKKDQGIIITLPNGETVRIAVVGIRGKSIRIGVEAPVNYLISREELMEAKP